MISGGKSRTIQEGEVWRWGKIREYPEFRVDDSLRYA